MSHLGNEAAPSAGNCSSRHAAEADAPRGTGGVTGNVRQLSATPGAPAFLTSSTQQSSSKAFPAVPDDDMRDHDT